MIDKQDGLLTEENEFTLLGWVRWYLAQSYNAGIQNLDIDHLEKARELLAKVLKQIGNRLNEPCPDSGEGIYKSPRCVRQLRDELLIGGASIGSPEAKRLDSPELREKIKGILKLAKKPDVGEGSVTFEDFWSDYIQALFAGKIEQAEKRGLEAGKVLGRKAGYEEGWDDAKKYDNMRKT